MKKFVFKKGKRHWLRKVKKLNDRKKESKNKRHLKAPDSKNLYNKHRRKKRQIMHVVEVKAPKFMLLKDKKQHTFYMKFIAKIEKASSLANRKKVKLFINFNETVKIYPDACVLLIATMDNIIALYPFLRFVIKKPIKNPHSIFDPHAVLCHLGFYKLLKLDYSVNCNSKYVKSWKYVSGNLTDIQLTEPLILEIKKLGINTNYIYRSYLEGIANCVEHAYMDELELNEQQKQKKWWMLLARINDELLLFVCDKGHGIPNTLKYTQPSNILNRLSQKIVGLFDKKYDCDHIKASMLVKETKRELLSSDSRTELSHRGKGKYDIRSFIDKTPNSELIIYSNKGTLVYNGKVNLDRSNCYDNELSINGTILQWTIPIQDS